MKRLLLTFLLPLLVINTYSQQSIKLDGIDSLVKTHMSNRHIPGLAIAIVKKGQVIKKSHYGVSNIETGTLVNENSVFEIASMTKQFICSAILILQQEGKLTVSDKVSKYLDDLPSSWNDITITHLMNHTSGLRDDWDEPTSYFYQNNTVEKMISAQKKYPLYFKPGDSFNYSSGPFFLGLVIKKVTGENYSTFLKERIFDPLKMSSTSVYEYRAVVPDRVSGYRWNYGVLENGEDIPPAAESRADVGIITSINDMIKWDLALKNNEFLEERSLKQMFRAGLLNNGKHIPYGYGWYIYFFRNNLIIEHGGAFRTGFGSRITLFPNSDLEIIILCNLWQSGLSELSTLIASYYIENFQRISELTTKLDPQIKRTKELEKLFFNASQKIYSRGNLYQLTNFSGFDPDELEDILKGFNKFEFLGKVEFKSNPIELYNTKIEKILYYKIIAEVITYWSFTFTQSNELISVNLED
ncbi:MAG: beta-lactamase family protein [Maribacter sp.]|nr:beta-lactamase family protein [Maribacter sp.]